MPYQQIPLCDHVLGEVKHVVRDVIDPYLSEFRFLLTVQRPDQGPEGSLRRLLVALLLAATDGAAQLLHPNPPKRELGEGERFKGFLKSNFPWELDKPDGLTIEEACDFLWDEVRCATLHRFGLRSQPRLRMKFGRRHSLSDADVTRLETELSQRPSSVSLRRNQQRTVLWIEPFYWSLRHAIARAVSTREKADSACAWIRSGAWDRTKKRSAEQ